MSVLVVTGFSPALWTEVGIRMVDTFDQYWPANCSLVAYHEEPVSLKRGELRYYDDCVGWPEFQRRHADNLAVQGREELPERPWKDKEKAAGYSYRFDAMRFCRVAFALEDAAQLCGPDIEYLVWLDGDTYTHTKVPVDWIEKLMEWSYRYDERGIVCETGANPVDFSTCFRERKYPEIGMQIYRLGNVHARQLIRAFRLMYHTDIFMNCTEWHTAFILGELAEGMAAGRGIALPGMPVGDAALRLGNLSLEPKGHVFATGLPSQYLDHLKGNRKSRGRSRELRTW